MHPAAADLHACYRRELDQALAAQRWPTCARGTPLTERRRTRLERSGVTQSQICDVEGSQYNRAVDTLARLAEAVGVPLHEMLNR